MDKFSSALRSHIMSKIRGKDTLPEIRVRSLLHNLGFRFRLHNTKLPGRPDIVLRQHNAIIFVHGCFWHQHSSCPDGRLPKSRKFYWDNKLIGNKKRDYKNFCILKRKGWKILRIWECQILNQPTVTKNRLVKFLKGNV